MKGRPPLSTVAGIAGTLCYVALALLAFSQYPDRYSPLHNWLSDLGSRSLNPQGALAYNVGIVATAVLLDAFFLGLSRWQIAGLRVQRAMLRITQAFGLLGCLAMVMSALYPIDNLAPHRFWSISLYVLLGTAFVFSVAALRYHPQCPRWVLAVGAITGLVDVVSAFLGGVYALEWLTVALFLAYVLIVGMATRAMRRMPAVWKGSSQAA